MRFLRRGGIPIYNVYTYVKYIWSIIISTYITKQVLSLMRLPIYTCVYLYVYTYNALTHGRFNEAAISVFLSFFL